MALPRGLAEALDAHDRLNSQSLVALCRRWPEHRRTIAASVMGAAVATADSLGLDAEAFLVGLRERMPKAEPITPPGEEPGN